MSNENYILPKTATPAEWTEIIKRAIGSLDVDAVSYVLEKGANPEVILQSGRNLVSAALVNGHLPQEKIKSHDYYRSYNQRELTLEAILCAGAKVNFADSHGTTPLHVLVERQRWDQVEVLLKRGADPELKNEKGQTPKQLAEKLVKDPENLRDLQEAITKNAKNLQASNDAKAAADQAKAAQAQGNIQEAQAYRLEAIKLYTKAASVHANRYGVDKPNGEAALAQVAVLNAHTLYNEFVRFSATEEQLVNAKDSLQGISKELKDISEKVWAARGKYLTAQGEGAKSSKVLEVETIKNLYLNLAESIEKATSKESTRPWYIQQAYDRKAQQPEERQGLLTYAERATAGVLSTSPTKRGLAG